MYYYLEKITTICGGVYFNAPYMYYFSHFSTYGLVLQAEKRGIYLKIFWSNLPNNLLTDLHAAAPYMQGAAVGNTADSHMYDLRLAPGACRRAAS